MKPSNENSQTITLLGKNFQIKCPEGKEEELETAAKFLQYKMLEMHKQNTKADYDHIATLTALNIAYEVMSNENYKENFVNEISDRIVTLQEKIRKALASNETIDV